jgi:alkanesulfonate monooxygenase SsuD/methylene tetrahydromethanopterin reductase-like flavin-dependent oxidoreductase (luciferase family)
VAVAVRVSVSLRSAYDAPDPRLGARWMVERAAAARAAGLDRLFVGDHHATPGVYYQNVPMLGRLLAEWGDRPAGALFLLPLWHPVLVAEQTATLASIAQGRFILQCAIGAGEEQFAGMGADLRARASRFETALEAIRRLWAGEEVDVEPLGVRGARLGLLPPEPVEVWIGGHAPRAVDRAARLGDAWLGGPDPTVTRAAELATLYLERCEAHGRRPTVVAIRRDIHVGADSGDARRVAEPVLAAGYRGFDPAATVYGSPEEVAQQFRELGELGYTEVVVRHLAGEQRDVLASFERLATVRALLQP